MSDVATAASQAELLDVEAGDAFFDPDLAGNSAEVGGAEADDLRDPQESHPGSAEAAQDAATRSYTRFAVCFAAWSLPGPRATFASTMAI